MMRFLLDIAALWMALPWPQKLFVIALLSFMGLGMGASLALLARAVWP